MNGVDVISEEIETALPDWQKIDTLCGGTRAMRDAKQDYLPRWPQESEASYSFRLNSTTLFNVFGRTLGNLAGKPFKKPITFEGFQPSVEEWMTDVDLAGRNMQVFSQEVFEAAIKYGLSHILVDYPVLDGPQKPVTVADEQLIGARPYLVHVLATNVLGWRSQIINGMQTLTMIRFQEALTVDDGAFGTKSITQIRVLEPGKWTIYRRQDNDNAKDWVVQDAGVTTLSFIPWMTFYTARTGFLTAFPPLNDIADLNIEHWQSSSDQRNVLHVARVPILTIIGRENVTAPIEVSTNTAVDLPTGGDMKFVEHTGRAIDAGDKDLQNIEERMRLLGAELLIKGPGRVSATQASLDTSQQQSYLAALAGRFEDYLDAVIGVMQQWAKLPIQGNTNVFQDFAIADFDNSAETIIIQAVSAGLLSRETAFAELQRRDTISPDIDWEDEQSQIEAEGPLLTGPAGFAKPQNVDPPGDGAAAV